MVSKNSRQAANKDSQATNLAERAQSQWQRRVPLHKLPAKYAEHQKDFARRNLNLKEKPLSEQT